MSPAVEHFGRTGCQTTASSSAPGAGVPIRFFIVDDEACVRQVLRCGIESISGFKCAGCFASGEEALASIPNTQGDVVLMDIRMTGMSGIECTHRLKIALPKLPTVMLTGWGDGPLITESLMAGAAGYLLKPVLPRECAEAMRKVLQGGTPMYEEAEALVRVFQHPAAQGAGDDLSPRQCKLMTCLFQKFSDKEIAQQLGIGIATVRSHMRGLFAKLGVTNRHGAVTKYLRSEPRD